VFATHFEFGGVGSRVSGVGCRVEGYSVGFGVQGSGFRV
jgi:hypothetical protein